MVTSTNVVPDDMRTEHLRVRAVSLMVEGEWSTAAAYYDAAADRYPPHSAFDHRARRDVESLRGEADACRSYAKMFGGAS